MALKLGNPGELLPVPPAAQREARHQVGTPELPGVVDFWHLASIETHEKPVTNALDSLVLWVADFVLDKLLAG